MFCNCGCGQTIHGQVVGVPIGDGQFASFDPAHHLGVQIPSVQLFTNPVQMAALAVPQTNPRPDTVGEETRDILGAMRPKAGRVKAGVPIVLMFKRLGRKGYTEREADDAINDAMDRGLVHEPVIGIIQRVRGNSRRRARRNVARTPVGAVVREAPAVAGAARETVRETRGTVRELKALRRELRKKNPRRGAELTTAECALIRKYVPKIGVEATAMAMRRDPRTVERAWVGRRGGRNPLTRKEAKEVAKRMGAHHRLAGLYRAGDYQQGYNYGASAAYRGVIREHTGPRARRGLINPQRPLTRSQQAFASRQISVWLRGRPSLRGRRGAAARRQLTAIAYSKARRGVRRVDRRIPRVVRGNPSASRTSDNEGTIRVEGARAKHIVYETEDTGELFKHRFKKGRLKVKRGQLVISPAQVERVGIVS